MAFKKIEGQTRCLVCKRSKDEAIREQLLAGEPCGHPDCAFNENIIFAIEKKLKIKIKKVHVPQFGIKKIHIPLIKINKIEMNNFKIKKIESADTKPKFKIKKKS